MSELIKAALLARANAYAPYSNYKVGAALRDSSGRIWSGCNVENVSYPLGVCAERNAVAAMVCGGGKALLEIVVATRDGGTPCGGCLQVLAEFAPEPSLMRVRLASDEGVVREYTLLELLPHGFRSAQVERTD